MYYSAISLYVQRQSNAKVGEELAQKVTHILYSTSSLGES